MFFLCLAAIGAFLLYKVGVSDFDWSVFLTSLRDVQPAWLAASIAATMLTYVARALRWQVLLTPLKYVRMGPLISSNILGFSAIYLLGRAGELVRPIWLTRMEQVPLTASLATVIVERFLDLFMVIAMFGLALVFVELPSAADETVAALKNGAMVIAAVSVTAMVFLYFFRARIEKITRFVPFEKVRALLKSFGEGLSFLDRGTTFGLVIAHSALVWGTIAIQFWFMLLGMNFQFSIAAATLVMVGVAIGSIAQIPVIGGGFQLAYIFCMTTFFAVPLEQATATALLAGILSYVPTVLAGGLYMISHGLSLKDLRTATAE